MKEELDSNDLKPNAPWIIHKHFYIWYNPVIDPKICWDMWLQ